MVVNTGAHAASRAAVVASTVANTALVSSEWGTTIATNAMSASAAASTPALGSMAAAAWAAAAPFVALAAVIGAATLAIVELVKHWDELDMLEGLKGIGQGLVPDTSGMTFGEGAAAAAAAPFKTMGKLFDPRTILAEYGIGSTQAGGPSAATLPSGVGPQGGDLRIKIDSEGRASVTQADPADGTNWVIDTGFAMVTP